MIEIVKLEPDEYRLRFRAWQWMREQPERYAESIGFDDFRDFCVPGYDEFQDYSIQADNLPVGFLTCILRAPGTCEIALITAPKIPVRPLLRALEQMQQECFEQFAHTIYMQTQNPHLKRLVVKLGWEECENFMIARKGDCK